MAERSESTGNVGQHHQHTGPTTVNTITNCSGVVVTGDISAVRNVNINSSFQGQQRFGRAHAIMEWTQRRIEIWTKDMVHTAALKDALEKLKLGATWLTIKGSPGEGKTTMAYMVLSELRKMGEEVFQVTSPDEFNEVTIYSSRPIIMLDDVLGDLEFDLEAWLKWKTVLHKVLDVKEHRSLERRQSVSEKMETILLVGRDYVLNSASVHMGRLSDYIIQDCYVVDMSHAKVRDYQEKLDIWKTIVERNGINLAETTVDCILALDGQHGFPHVCRLFVTIYRKSPRVCPKSFFKTPLEFLNETVASFLKTKPKLHLFKEMIKNRGKVSDRELESLGNEDILESAVELVGTYMRKEDDYFVFDHPSVYDSVAFTMCRCHCLFVIQNCNLTFIHERLRLPVSWDTKQMTPISDCSLVVYIPRSYIGDLARRFATEIFNKNLSKVLSHQAFMDTKFTKNVMSHLNIPINKLIRFSDTITNETFLSLSVSNKSPELLKYINGHTNIQLSQPDKNDVLFGVCRYAASNVLEYLLKAWDHIEIDARDSYDRTPIMVAAGTKDDLFVHQIVTLNPNLVARSGFLRSTTLHYLCQNGLVSCVKYAIDAGTDIEVKDVNGHTPLHYACMYNQVGVLRLLLDRGAILYNDAVEIACIEGNLSVVEMLIETGIIDMLSIEDRLLTAACMGGNIKMIGYLIDRGASVYITSRKSEISPLSLVCLHDMPKAAKYLLDRGEDTKSRSMIGSTPLHFAASTGSEVCLNLLLQAGAVVNAQNEYGLTPLHEAALGGFSHEWGAQRAVDVSLKSIVIASGQCHCESVSHGVQEKNSSNECVTTLLKSGADVNYQCECGSTPLLLAALGGHAERVDTLVKSGADVNLQRKAGDTPLIAAATMGHKECLVVLLKAGANVDMKSEQGHTALHVAAGMGYEECVDVLLEAGANVNVQNHYGYTPLHTAVHYSRYCHVHLPLPIISICQSLVKHDANMNLQDEEGNTPLHLLCQADSDHKIGNDGSYVNNPFYNKGFTSLVVHLCNHGAGWKIRNKHGVPALHGRFWSLFKRLFLKDCIQDIHVDLMKLFPYMRYLNESCRRFRGNMQDNEIAVTVSSITIDMFYKLKGEEKFLLLDVL